MSMQLAVTSQNDEIIMCSTCRRAYNLRTVEAVVSVSRMDRKASKASVRGLGATKITSKSMPVFAKLLGNDWTGQIIYLKMLACESPDYIIKGRWMEMQGAAR